MEIGSTIDRRGGAGEPLEHRRNEILDEARVEPIAMVMRRGLEWFGHVKKQMKQKTFEQLWKLRGGLLVKKLFCSFFNPVMSLYIYYDTFFQAFEDSSSSSGAVFLKKVGCHDSPLLPILKQSHEVFVVHSRPICDICHPLRSWPSSVYFPLQWTLQQ